MGKSCFLEVGLKFLNTFPKPPNLIKDIADFFFYPFAFCFSVSLVIALTKRGPSSPSWKHLSDADSSLSFSVIPLCIFSPHWLASCACCVTYAPLPLGSTPPLRSQGTKGLLLLFEEAGRKVSSHTPKRRKASAFGERGGAPPGQWGALWFFFFLFSEISHEKKWQWKLTLMQLFCWVDVWVA